MLAVLVDPLESILKKPLKTDDQVDGFVKELTPHLRSLFSKSENSVHDLESRVGIFIDRLMAHDKQPLLVWTLEAHPDIFSHLDIKTMEDFIEILFKRLRSENEAANIRFLFSVIVHAAICYKQSLATNETWRKTRHTSFIHHCVSLPVHAVSLLDCLVQIGLDVYAPDRSNRNILHHIKQSDNPNIFVYLDSKGFFDSKTTRFDSKEIPTIPRAALQEITLVLDLDKTLWFDYRLIGDKIPAWLQIFIDKKLALRFNDYIHVLFPGAIETLRFASTYPNLRLIFFSAGPPDRSSALCPQLMDMALGEARARVTNYRIYSVTSCTPMMSFFAKIQKAKFGVSAGMLNKNLYVLGFNLAWTVLWDDIFTHSFCDQEENILYLKYGKKCTADLFAGMHARSLTKQKSRKDEFLLIHQLFYAVALFLRALQIARGNGITLAKALFSLQFMQDQDGYIYKPDLINDKRIYQEGFEELKKYNPDISYYTTENSQAFFNSYQKLFPATVEVEKEKPAASPETGSTAAIIEVEKEKSTVNPETGPAP